MKLKVVGRTPPQYGHWVIQDTVMGLTVLFGEPGTYKSFLAMSMSVAVAGGKPWFGKKVKQGPVLYLMGEGQDGSEGRFAEAAREIGVVPDDNYRLAVYPVFDLNKPHALEPLFEEWDELGWDTPPVMVVVDTVSRYLEGDENKQEDMRAFVTAVDSMKERWGCAVVVLHHKSKPQMPGQKGTIRGSTVLPGAADVMLDLTRPQNSKTLNITAAKLKDLDVEQFHPNTLEGVVRDSRKDNGLPILDDYGRPRSTLVLREPVFVQEAVERAKEMFFNLFVTRPACQAVGIKEWEEACGLNHALFTRAIMGLLTDGTIKKVEAFFLGHYTLGDNEVKVTDPGISYQETEEYDRIAKELEAKEYQEEMDRLANVPQEYVPTEEDVLEEARRVLEEQED